MHLSPSIGWMLVFTVHCCPRDDNASVMNYQTFNRTTTTATIANLSHAVAARRDAAITTDR